jgi:hypothetical protein
MTRMASPLVSEECMAIKLYANSVEKDTSQDNESAHEEKKRTGLKTRRYKESFAAEDARELGGGEGEAGAAAGNEIDVARDIELANFQFFHPTMLDFPLHTHARDNGHAHAHLHEALDAFDSGHFDGHVESGAMAREELDDAAAKRRFDAVGDESFFSQFGNVNFAFFRKDMFRGNDQGQLILQDFCGLELRVARDEGNGAKIEAVVQDFVRNVAGKHAVNAHLDAAVEFAEFGEGGKKSVDGAFVDPEREFAALEAFEFRKTLFDFVAEVDEALGVIAEKGARIGQADGAGAADE